MEPEALTDDQYGKSEKFLSVDQLFEFRFLSALLSFSNGLEEAKGATNEPNDDARYRILFETLTHLVNLFVRHSEVAAVTASDKTGALLRATYQDLGSDHDDLENDIARVATEPSDRNAEASLSVSRNFKRDFDQGNLKLYPDDKTYHKKHPPLEVTLEDTIADKNLGDVTMAQWILSRTERTVEFSKYPTTDVSFAEHCANVVKLIKDTHSATDITMARDKLRNYVLLSSCAKIHGRLVRGVDERNLFEFVVTSSTTLATKMGSNNMFILLGTAGYAEALRSFTSEERATTLRLCKFLKSHLESMPPENQTKEAKDDTNYISIFQTHLEDEAREISYNVEIMTHLQVLISNIVHNVNKAINNLVRFKRKAQIHRVEYFDQWPIGPKGEDDASFQTNITSLDAAASDAGGWLRSLSELVEQLRPFVLANLACIRIGFTLENVKRKDEDRTSAQAYSSKPQAKATTSMSSSLPGSEIGGNEGFSHAEQSITEDMRNSKIQDEYYTEFSNSIDLKAWETGAYEWLRLICVHTFAYTTLSRNILPSPHGEKVSKVFRRAELNVIKTSTKYSDNQLYIHEYLEKFTYTHGKEPKTFSDEDKDLIVDWLSTYGRGFNKNRHLTKSAERSMSTGTYHCETLLICLFLLGQMREELVDPDAPVADLESESFHLKLPSKELTDKMKDALDVLSVTKRCCPACHALVQYIVDIMEYKPDMLYAGNHTEWSQGRLPPFIPKEAGETVIEAAKKALEPRLKKMIKIMKKEHRRTTVKSYRSTATTVVDSSTYSPVNSFVEPEGMVDSDYLNYTWPEDKKREASAPSSPTAQPKAKKAKDDKPL
ncbi:hypothetical protein M3J09_000025 [Ascochyta lentis]